MRRPLVLLLLVAVAVLGGSSALSGTSGKGGSQAARLVRVVDGDTLLVRTEGRRESVRLIGIDTPESVAPGRPVECGGEEASAALHRRAPAGSRLKLVFDATQDRRDVYHRLLAYAELDGADLGEGQLRRGWAEVYVFDRPFKRLSRYRKAFRRAREEALGVHRSCGGDFDAPQ